MNIDNIRRTLNSQAGKDLLEYLMNEADKVKDVGNVKISLNPIKSAIELRAVEKTHKSLINIIEYLSHHSVEETEKGKDSYE